MAFSVLQSWQSSWHFLNSAWSFSSETPAAFWAITKLLVAGSM